MNFRDALKSASKCLSAFLFFLALTFTAPAAPAPAKPAYDHGEFEPTVPLVFITTSNAINPNIYVPATARFLAPKGDRYSNTDTLAAKVSIHGSSSQAYPKKSLKLALEQPAPLAGLGPRKHWVLNAAFIDRSLMRHKLSYDLFLSLGAPEAPRFAAASRFVEVYLNGRYNGAYLLMERVDRQLLGFRLLNTNDFTHGCLYKAVDHAANFGYAGNAGYEQREPDSEVMWYWKPLEELNRFVSRAPTAEFFHAGTGIASRLDLDNAIDFHLLVLITSNSDGITKNFHLARDGQASGPVTNRFFFVPWDYDGTFGRNWNAHDYPSDVWLSNNLFERLMQSAEYRAKFAARWRQLRERQFSMAAIHGMIDDNARALEAAMARNVARWPTTGWPYPERLTFAEDLAEMKTWVEARVKWLDREISRRAGK